MTDTGGDNQYSRETVIAATLLGAAFTMLGVGFEGLAAHYGKATASEPYFWIIPGAGLLILALMYGHEVSVLPGVGSR